MLCLNVIVTLTLPLTKMVLIGMMVTVAVTVREVGIVVHEGPHFSRRTSRMACHTRRRSPANYQLPNVMGQHEL